MAHQNKLRIIVDCNWFISASINRKSRRTLYKIITHPNFLVIYSDELLTEYRTVIKRAKFQKIIKLSQAKRFVDFLKPRMMKVKIKQSNIIGRDKNDDYLLNLAKTANVSYLITGDNDLLVLKQYHKTNIVTMADFLVRTFQRS